MDNNFEKKTKIKLTCYAVAAVCFAMVGYGNFVRGNSGLGILFAAISVAQVTLACITCKKAEETQPLSKKGDGKKDEEEK